MITSKKERVHFIAIGGSVMHSLAIALKTKGYIVTGSDDDIFEPSYSRLEDTICCQRKTDGMNQHHRRS